LNLEKFLAVNRSCKVLNMNRCSLNKEHIQFMANGLAKNTTL